MNKIIPFLLFAVFASSCVSLRPENSSVEKNVSGRDLLLASFFDAPDSAPEIKTLEVFFLKEERASLKKQAKKEIEDFAALILSYEDYEVSCEFYFTPQLSKKLYEKRVDAVKKILIKNGIDKDRIYIKESETPKNIKKDSAFIEAQVWR